MIDVVLLPHMLDERSLADSQVVVLDVLRATSTVVTALHNGAAGVRLFDRADELVAAKAAARLGTLAAGERGCHKIPGFDLGNSPAEYSRDVVDGKAIFLSTTNGTRAAVAASSARRLLIGSLLNAHATAKALLEELDGGPTILLAAGTEGRIAIEDVIGAGAILWHILDSTLRPDLPFTDSAWMAYQCFTAVRGRLPAALRLGQGGINLINAGLESDIDLCTQLDSSPIAVTVQADNLTALKLQLPNSR